MLVKFIKLCPEAVTPSQAYPGDAGFDLTAISMSMCLGGITYGTGLAIEIPAGYVGLLFPRSSVYKTGLSLANSVGVIDSGYRGEIKLIYRSREGEPVYRIGERVGQIVIVPSPEIELMEVVRLPVSKRANQGFGSSGRQ